MKLLFDENLSHRLGQLVGTEYPGSVHVRSVGLLGADDARIWEHARAGGYAIVSKDCDFRPGWMSSPATTRHLCSS